MSPDETPVIADDDSISGEWLLLRRIPPWHYDPDRPRPLSKAAFDDDSDGPMSVYIQEKLIALGGQPFDALVNHDQFGLGTLKVQIIRDLGFAVVSHPIDETPLGQSHAEVHCNKTDGKQRRMRDAFVQLVAPGRTPA